MSLICLDWTTFLTVDYACYWRGLRCDKEGLADLVLHCARSTRDPIESEHRAAEQMSSWALMKVT